MGKIGKQKKSRFGNGSVRDRHDALGELGEQGVVSDRLSESPRRVRLLPLPNLQPLEDF